MSEPDIKQACDAFFETLDAAATKPGSALPDASAKEWLETYVLRAFDRVQAAKYHAERVHTLCDGLEQLRKEAHDRMSHQGAPTLSSEGRMTSNVAFPLRDLAYEIDALLAAVRTSVDFIAQGLAQYVAGMNNVRSITKLLKMVKRTNSAPFADLLTKWRSWIELIKNYRDTFTHYRTLRGSVGVSVKSVGGKVSSAVRPFVIPEAPGKDKPDTRASRMMTAGDVPEGVAEMSVLSSISKVDGSTEVLRHEHSFEAGAGFVSAEDFCDAHLVNLDAFFVDAIQKMQGFDFSLQKIPSK